jgi:hypothetical protein
MDSENECEDDNLHTHFHVGDDLPPQIVLENGLLGSSFLIRTFYTSFVEWCFVEFYYICILVCLFIYFVFFVL